MTKHKNGKKTEITADVIVLGCSLPGVLMAHNLKKMFGDSLDIVVLDLPHPPDKQTHLNVAFTADIRKDEREDSLVAEITHPTQADHSALSLLTQYTQEFRIPLPNAIANPQRYTSTLNKLFQYTNGSFVKCKNNYYSFEYLNVIERFELSQYHTLLEQSMEEIFTVFTGKNIDADKKKLLYYDQTNMEDHICDGLLFPTSREIMRNAVRLVCGASADSVSVLFYLHQCYRTRSPKNQLDGHNTRLREKLLGFCRNHLRNKLQQSVADITMPAKDIMEISTHSNEQVILKTIHGDNDYVCNWLAMAMRPDELFNIAVETCLMSKEEVAVTSSMVRGQAKKFVVQYEENFWRRAGYSGDILSIRGPIIWAMEQPLLSSTGKVDKFASLIGYLKTENDSIVADSEAAVLEQLVKLFGDEAGKPISYKESDINDFYIPKCGDYITLRKMTCRENPVYLEWAAFDIFRDGDVVAALEAGHIAFLHLMRILRPQASSFDDLMVTGDDRVAFDRNPVETVHGLGFKRGFRIAFCTAMLYIGFRTLMSYLRGSRSS